MKKNIAVITGGAAAELGISLKSADVVFHHLSREKFNVYKVIIEGSQWVLNTADGEKIPVDKNDFSTTLNGTRIKFDAVFVAIHGTPAEDGKLQGYFELLGIPYNCCGVLQAALTFDKQKCKEYLRDAGIRSARAYLLTQQDTKSERNATMAGIYQLGFPLFVKPNKNGSSYGASKVDEASALESAIAEAFKYDDEILVEEYLKGIEVTCGVITLNGVVTPLPLTEIRSKKAFFDYQAKYEGASQEVTPAEIDVTLSQQIQDTSAKIYRHLGFRGMCRIDYIIRDGVYFMLEVNSIPGLSEESIVPQQARAHGLTLTQLFDSSVEACLY